MTEANNDTNSVAKKPEHTRGPSGHRGTVRDRIRRCAHTEFVERGYDGATMREIARNAGCDSAMVTYYFDSKQRLFRECFNLPSDPAEDVLSCLAPGPEGAGERLVRYALVLYEEHLTSETMQALMRALITDAATGRRFRDYIRTDVLDRVAKVLGSGDELAEQIELAMSMLYGMATMRYVVRLEPLASMPRDRIVAEFAPLIQERIDQVVAGVGLH